MSKNNSLRHKDIQNKLDKYKKINKEISKKLTEKRIQNTKWINLFTSRTSDLINIQNECRKWQCKIMKIRNMHMDQTLSTTIEVETLKSNADKIKSALDECIAEMDQYLATPAPPPFKHTNKRPKKAKGDRKFS